MDGRSRESHTLVWRIFRWSQKSPWRIFGLSKKWSGGYLDGDKISLEDTLAKYLWRILRKPKNIFRRYSDRAKLVRMIFRRSQKALENIETEPKIALGDIQKEQRNIRRLKFGNVKKPAEKLLPSLCCLLIANYLKTELSKLFQT